MRGTWPSCCPKCRASSKLPILPAGFRGSIPRGEQTASLGLYYDERYPGPGMKVTEVLANGPFDVAETALKPGDVLRQISGEGRTPPIEARNSQVLRGRRADQLVA